MFTNDQQSQGAFRGDAPPDGVRWTGTGATLSQPAVPPCRCGVARPAARGPEGSGVGPATSTLRGDVAPGTQPTELRHQGDSEAILQPLEFGIFHWHHARGDLALGTQPTPPVTGGRVRCVRNAVGGLTASLPTAGPGTPNQRRAEPAVRARFACRRSTASLRRPGAARLGPTRSGTEVLSVAPSCQCRPSRWAQRLARLGDRGEATRSPRRQR